MPTTAMEEKDTIATFRRAEFWFKNACDSDIRKI
jgi:hypothetical protein